MIKYQLTQTEVVIRIVTIEGVEYRSFIPNDPANIDRQEYEEWLAKGHTPDASLWQTEK
jgi:hypothetical protein